MNGAVVVVTGGTRGVGAGIAGAFLRAGAQVIVCARRPPSEPVGTARYLPVDVRKPALIQALLDRVAAEYGRLDVLVNNAGGTPHHPLDAEPWHRHARILELNLTAPLMASLAAHRLMRAQPGGGSILMIGSVSGSRPSPGTAAYGAAKAGLEHLARSMAVEWAPLVRVNTLILGMVHTESAQTHYGDREGVAAVARTVPAGRLAEPEEVGEAAVFLASERAAYITGAALLLHGGGERPAFLAAANAQHPTPDGRLPN
ncbi:SDR family oxidoreductase [Streptomyces orinoci]|uniref:SDR family oxidoreductase n=1 Tax=Streptomyces orinoci TaxID=67339 RepID=A0ABV3JVD4_STRON|nr:SDR family oxidoreductase [Streptomyces orinoci]